MANVDLGHWVAGGNKGGTPMDFLTKYHDRTASFHLKDRTTPEHCAMNLLWGTGEAPITQDPPAGEEEQVEDPCVDRARIRRAGGFRRGKRSAPVPRLLPQGAGITAVGVRDPRLLDIAGVNHDAIAQGQ